jgi:hypothetical protein
MDEGRAKVPIEEIKRALVAQILELCRDILPNGMRQGSEWCVGSLAGEKGTSLGVHLSGPRAGIWCDFAGGPADKGDLLKLIALIKCHGGRKAAVKWAVRWLGLDDSGNSQQRRRSDSVEKTTTVNRGNPEGNYRAIARKIYLEGQAELRGTPVEAYLTGRAIDLARFARRPHLLRFHPRCWNSETRRNWPAMIAGIVDHRGKFLSPNPRKPSARHQAGSSRYGPVSPANHGRTSSRMRRCCWPKASKMR